MNTLLAWKISEIYLKAADLRQKGWIGTPCSACHGSGMCGNSMGQDEECRWCDGECFSWTPPQPILGP